MNMRQAVIEYLKANNVGFEMDSSGGLFFILHIDISTITEEEGAQVPTSRGMIPIECFLVTPDITNDCGIADAMVLFAEIPFGVETSTFPYLYTLVNQFNMEGLLSGSVFYDQQENSLFYRQMIYADDSSAIDSVLDKLFERAAEEIAYSVAGLGVMDDHLKEQREQKRRQGPAKILHLFGEKHPK